MANARNSLPSAAERVKREQGVAARGWRAPFPAPIYPPSPPDSHYFPSVASFVGYSGSTQGQLKLTAIYCISIMVSRLSLSTPSPFPRLLLHRRVSCLSPPSPVSRPFPPLSTYVQHERARALHSRFTTSFMVHTVCESTQKYPTANYPASTTGGNCIIPRKLFRATRAHACMYMRNAASDFYASPESSLTRIGKHIFLSNAREVGIVRAISASTSLNLTYTRENIFVMP